MKSILVATDFSERSVRALRRATLLAKGAGARLTLVHVVDDDQPERLLEAERAAAASILNDLIQTLKNADGMECDFRIVEGDPFEGILRAAGDLEPDIVVIGPHRRHALKDVFVGTTAERAIRASRRPILMANGVPAGSYRNTLVAVDLSECSADALRTLKDLVLDKNAAVSVLHVFDAPGTSLMSRASVSENDRRDYVANEARRASQELDTFLKQINFAHFPRLVRHNDSTTADVISKVAQELSADLLVVGTRGRTGIGRLLLGSVTHEVLRKATIDVLSVPPRIK